MTQARLETPVSRREALRAGLGAVAGAALVGWLDVPGATASITRGSAAAGGKAISTLNVGLPGTLSNIYPGVEAGILNYYVAALVAEGLVALSPSGAVVPALAKSWKRPDARTYVYNLRSDARFTDGTPMQIEDVLYSLQMAMSAKASPTLASYYAGATVKQTGANQVTIKLAAASESFQYAPSAAEALWVAPKTFWEKNHNSIGTASALLDGTGPYKVTSFQPDSHVYLKASRTWWGGKPAIDAINIQFIADDNARYLAQKSGAIKMAFNVPFESLSQWKSLRGSRVISVPDRSWVGLIFNVKTGPTQDIHVRNAIGHCIDRTAIVKQLLKGQGQVASAMSTPQQFAGVYTPQRATAMLAKIPQPEFSIAKAKQELAQSSYPKGFSTTLTYPNTGAQLGTAALSLAQNLQQIGVKLNVKEVPVSEWLNSVGAAGSSISYMWYFATTPDPAELPSWLLQSNPLNPAKYVNKGVDALLAKAAAATDPAKHAAAVIAAEKLASADLPYLSLWWGYSATAVADGIGIRDYTSYTFEAPWADSLYATS